MSTAGLDYAKTWAALVCGRYQSDRTGPTLHGISKRSAGLQGSQFPHVQRYKGDASRSPGLRDGACELAKRSIDGHN